MNCLIVNTEKWGKNNFEIIERRVKKIKWFLISSKQQLNAKLLAEIKPRYIFFPHWSWIIPKEIWSKYECVVFHMTDLPYGRGGTPLQNLILRGYKATKISAIKVNCGVDEGDIYLKRSLNLSGSAEEVYRRASKTIFFRMIPYIIENKLLPKTQIGKVTLFRRRKPAESKLPENLGLKKTYDFIRMLDAEGYPRSFLETDKLRIEFRKAKLKKNKLFAEVNIYEK